MKKTDKNTQLLKSFALNQEIETGLDTVRWYESVDEGSFVRLVTSRRVHNV